MSGGEVMMVVLCCTNLVNYIDRGIVPGAADKFDAFIDESMGGKRTNAYFGALQSAFIVGYSLGSVVVGHLVHSRPPFRLAAYGLLAWCGSAALAGFSRSLGSYELLLLARMASGLGEAGFVTVGGPYIQDVAGEKQGKWLGAFFACIPLGTAIGYGYGALVAETLTWSWCFFIEALVMLPFALSFLFSEDDGSQIFRNKDESYEESLVNFNDDDDERHLLNNDESPRSKKSPVMSIKEEFLLCGRQPTFVWVALGYAGYAGAILGFSTFAPSIVVGLGLWDSLPSASVAFSGTIAASGIIGTPIGGLLLDRAAKRSNTKSEQVPALELSLLFNGIGALVVCAAAVMMTKVLFLFLLFLGTLPLFAATSPMNVALYASVPRENRAFGQALGVMIMHAAGDVPTPIIVGALLDDDSMRLLERLANTPVVADRAALGGKACRPIVNVAFKSAKLLQLDDPELINKPSSTR